MKACLEKPSCILEPKNVVLFKLDTALSTARASPICTIAHPSLVLRNLILTTLPYRQNRLKTLAAFIRSKLRPYTMQTEPWC